MIKCNIEVKLPKPIRSVDTPVCPMCLVSVEIPNDLIPLVIITLVIYLKLVNIKDLQIVAICSVRQENLPLWLTFLFRADSAAARAEAMSLPPPGATPAGGKPLPCGPVSPPEPPPT